MKYVLGFLFAVLVILVCLMILLSAAGNIEHLYVSYTNYSPKGKAAFLAIVAAVVLGAIALVVCFSRPQVEYWD